MERLSTRTLTGCVNNFEAKLKSTAAARAGHDAKHDADHRRAVTVASPETGAATRVAKLCDSSCCMHNIASQPTVAEKRLAPRGSVSALRLPSPPRPLPWAALPGQVAADVFQVVVCAVAEAGH